ncbi:T9SS type A sorting domain-containing protein [candidate division KSB1 bacterium]|nr:T9SS type A sorting domain-containing protein [candidate division KSB1 bacterium]
MAENSSLIQPGEFSLGQNYPNPFNPTTRIDYSVPDSGPVMLKLYNSIGQEIRTLVDGVQTAGAYHVIIDSQGLSSGHYFDTLIAGNLSQIKKMVVLH